MARQKRIKKLIRPVSFGDSLRERVSLRSKKEQDIRELWEEQKRQKTEAILLEREIKKTKKQARELKKRLNQNYMDAQWNLVRDYGSKIKKLPASIKRISAYFNKVKLSRRHLIVFPVVLVIVTLVILRPDSKSDTSTLGVVATNSSQENLGNEENKVARDEVSFDVMTPNGIKESELKTVSRRSPSGDIVFSYQETIGEAVIEVTQQQLPTSFVGLEDVELQKAATNLNETNIIQINDVKIYHGSSEKEGIQSLVTIKNDTLILIRSSKKQTDEFWTGYYLSLQ